MYRARHGLRGALPYDSWLRRARQQVCRAVVPTLRTGLQSLRRGVRKAPNGPLSGVRESLPQVCRRVQSHDSLIRTAKVCRHGPQAKVVNQSSNIEAAGANHLGTQRRPVRKWPAQVNPIPLARLGMGQRCIVTPFGQVPPAGTVHKEARWENCRRDRNCDFYDNERQACSR